METATSLVLSGSSGLIGSALGALLAGEGRRVRRLVRRRPAPGEPAIQWDPLAGQLDAPSLAGADAVVHLAGEGIASGRWDAVRRERIRRSRVDGTRLLAAALGRVDPPPRVLVCASAVGYYGDRGDELLTEDSGPGRGFLPSVCAEWEEAASPARAAGVRVVHLRFGMVLAADGGALSPMVSIFRLGLGGRLGTGRQYCSWIALDDALAAIRHLLALETADGAYNLTAPAPVPQSEFAGCLGRALRRPALLPAPAWALRLVLGELADALLLASTRAHPTRLLAAGYRFQYPELAGALSHLLAPDPSP
jgi:uncharacterized protein (TIGR01777 family)